MTNYEEELDEKIEKFNKETFHFVMTVFVSALTAAVITRLMLM